MMARLDREKRLEIREYIGALEGRGRIVAAVAIVAGFLAVVVYILQPQRYSATATVVLPIPPSTTTSAIAAVSQAYADFNGALATDVVAERAAADVGVPASSVSGHLSVSRVAGGSVAQVTYNGTDKDHAIAIASAASREALVVLIAARLAPLDQQLTLTQTAYNAANDEYRTFIQETGVSTEQYFIALQKRIIDLQDQLGGAEANGDTASAARIQANIDAKSLKMSENRADFDRLTSARQSALEAYTTAQQADLSEKGLLDSAREGGQVSASAGPTGASRLTGLIKAVVPAVVVATGLAIALIVLMEVVGPVRLPTRGSRRHGDEGEEGDDEGKVSETVEQELEPKEPEPKEPELKEPEPKEPEPKEPEEPELEEPARDPAGRPIRTRA
jgi:capsular polysaccharide biosynthesis protein